MASLLQVRVTGILIEDEKLLLVKQKVTADREWSLPGGRVERGETLEQAVVRELEEETGLITKVTKLLYICDKPDAVPPLLHYYVQRFSDLVRNGFPGAGSCQGLKSSIGL